jgi:micrococcal nuclease
MASTTLLKRALRDVRKPRKLRYLLAVLALVAALSQHVTANRGSAAGGADTPGRVVRVVDGDTIDVATESGKERIRYIGIDTPESKKPGVPVQCFALKAAAKNKRLVDGKKVTLHYDVERHDRYGRTLAYVTVGKISVQETLVRGGYARAKAYPPNTRHRDQFERLERRARAAGRGMWGRC